MAFDIATFQEALKEQGARPNLFEMTLTIPSGMGSAVVNTNFTHLCKTAQIPGSTIGVVEVQYFGRPVKMPGNRTFENLTTMNNSFVAGKLQFRLMSTPNLLENSKTSNTANKKFSPAL